MAEEGCHSFNSLRNLCVLRVFCGEFFSETLIHTMALARWTTLTQNRRNRFNGLFLQANKIAARRKPLKRFLSSVCCDITRLAPQRGYRAGDPA